MQEVHDENPPRRRGRGRLPADEASVKRQREIEALAKSVAQQRKRLQELQDAQRRAEKSARRTFMNQRKFAVGGLAQIAGLLEADPGFVLGALLYVGDSRERDGRWPGELFERYKQRGDAELAARAAARKQRKSADDDED